MIVIRRLNLEIKDRLTVSQARRSVTTRASVAGVPDPVNAAKGSRGAGRPFSPFPIGLPLQRVRASACKARDPLA